MRWSRMPWRSSVLAVGAGLVVAVIGTPAAVAPGQSDQGSGVPAGEGRATPTGDTDWGEPVDCPLDADEPTVVEGTFTPAEAKTYRMVPFTVPEGTTRIEVGYAYDDVPPPPDDPDAGSTVDLGVWDAAGYDTVDGFRGWSGSRQGKVDDGQDPVWVQAGSAERGYTPGPIEPGTWYVELGAGGVAPEGTDYRVEISCHSAATRPEAPADEGPPESDPVDPTHVANDEPGWYVGDFHLHAYHSNPEGLAPEAMVEAAIDAGLDIVPVTEYVTDAHHSALGAAQRSHPDVLIWPGREIITYAGHAIVLGETPGTVEYRQGFEGVSLGAIQEQVHADGALFGIAHPTIFPPDEFGNACRGCAFQLTDEIDWSQVDTLELHTGTIPPSPFTETALDLWDRLLAEGHRITGVSGSDDKSGDDYGATATAVYAEALSRPAVAEALRAGHAQVHILGAEASPHLELQAEAPDGTTAIMGDTLVADTATAELTIAGGAGQTLELRRNGQPAGTVGIEDDETTLTLELDRDRATEGPLGTIWRLQVRDGDQLTTIANPIFLADEEPTDEPVPTPESTATGGQQESGDDGLPVVPIAIGLGIGAAIGIGYAIRRSRAGG